MSYILHIDTATEYAGVCLSKGPVILGLRESLEQKNHAAFVQPAIQDLVRETGVSLASLDAVSVSAGPGSYTGLRVGLASAKGICFALGKPLILLGTLQIIAACMREELVKTRQDTDDKPLLCPMIDARRMEVFTAMYSVSLDEVMAPYALILEENSFATPLASKKLVFGGSGHVKLQSKLHDPNAIFLSVRHNAGHMVDLAINAYLSGRFANLAYAEPLYVKEFFDRAKPV